MRVAEINITVPWGSVAAKTWGECNDPHVLVFHGVQDNAASFDRLIPHLPSCYYYVCFDLPGHGKSSYLPLILPFHSQDLILFCKLMVKHFGKEKYILMGHSLGGQISSLFARQYPHYVEKLILLETLHSLPVTPDDFHTFSQKTYDFIEKLPTIAVPTYSYEEALNRVSENRYYVPLVKESAQQLLKRSLVSTGRGRYYFSTDPRMKYRMDPPHDLNYIMESLEKKPFKCHVLIILGTENVYQLDLMRPVINVFERNKLVAIHYVSGAHDIHMNSPEAVAEHIVLFLRKQNSKM